MKQENLPEALRPQLSYGTPVLERVVKSPESLKCGLTFDNPLLYLGLLQAQKGLLAQQSSGGGGGSRRAGRHAKCRFVNFYIEEK